jgi:hypothetical protein
MVAGPKEVIQEAWGTRTSRMSIMHNASDDVPLATFAYYKWRLDS